MLQREHSPILSTFIKPPIVIKIFFLSNFEWPIYTGFTLALTYIVLSMENDMQIVFSLLEHFITQTSLHNS